MDNRENTKISFYDEISNYMPQSTQEESDKKVILDFIKQHKNTVLTRENKIAHITSSGLIVNDKVDKLLMIHHNIYKTWTWTGGHADGQPYLLDVALKEGKEETGLSNLYPLMTTMATLDILPVYGHVRRGDYVCAHLHMNIAYVLVADEAEPLVINEDETSGVQWIKAKELSQYSNEPALIAVYEKMIERARRFQEGRNKG